MKTAEAYWSDFENDLWRELPPKAPVSETRIIATSERGKDRRDWVPRDIERIRLAQRGNGRATAAVCASYEGFIRSTSRRYILKTPWLEEDILQVAREGFLYALLKKYDTEAGYELTTYSDRWIRHYVGRFLDDCERTIRVSTGSIDAVRQAIKRGAETAEDAQAMFPTTKGIKAAWAARTRSPSLDEVRKGADGWTMTLLEKQADVDSEQADVSLERSELSAHVQASLAVLTPIEKRILERRFMGKGRSPDGEDTLKAIGNTYSVCRERIRQIERRALKKVEKALRKIPDVRSSV